jgi:hypothetical protein
MYYHNENLRMKGPMTQEEKLDKVSKDFSSLSEDKRDYILGVLQALVFAKNEQALKTGRAGPEAGGPGTVR